MDVVRNFLAGFRSGWHRVKAIRLTFDVKSDIEPAQVDHFDYAADGTEDDEKEFKSAKAKDNESSKVRSTKSCFNQ